MPLYVKKPGNTWSGPITPWIKKPGNAWVTPTKTFVKTGASTWIETWPLLPGLPTSPGMSWVYRNDRIEVDLSWGAAPGSGTNATPVANANYVVYLIINNAIYGGYNLGTATSFTLTDGDGFQDKAGQPVYFVVQAQSAAGVYGSQVASGTTTIPQLPAPPAVTSLNAPVTFGDMAFSFNHVAGNRLSYFQVNVTGPTGNATYFYGAATTVNASNHPWNGGDVNGGYYQVDVYPVGPGGTGPVTSYGGLIPGDVVFANTRMFSDNPFAYGANVSRLIGDASLGSNSSAYQLYWSQEGGGNNYYGNLGAGHIELGAGTIGAAQARFRWVGVPLNAYGSGRVCASPFVRRIANPIYIRPVDTETNIPGQPGGWSGTGLVEQGYDSGYGSIIFGYAFYGNQFRDAMNDSLLGFRAGIYSGQLGIYRATLGGPGAVAPQLYLHTAADRNGANNVFSGGQPMSGVNVNDSYRQDIPSDWVRYLIDQTNGWKGLGIYRNIGADTSQNIRLWGTDRNHDLGRVRDPIYNMDMYIFHDG